MTPEEHAADMEDKKRRKAKGRRLNAIEDLDPVENVLNGDSLCPDLEGAEEMGDIKSFQYRVSNFRNLDLYWYSPELYKFALCDWRVPRHRKDYDNAGLEDMYQKYLRWVRNNDRREQARAVARPTGLKSARYWAQKMVDEFEAAAAKGEQPDALKAWVGMRIRTPPWDEDISQSKENYGFIIY
ncbi:hypothetical protein FSARC_13317 [Fusarium sarcochroum]|uniref:Uncharacterized protein n=1 Tax=Fusarium sarcochroum TaxID=1208366 RepID=A0A8H4WTB5_9HYPO|nr:hypothetical protein FSARC_13317 [Fusarium sarcochroum]